MRIFGYELTKFDWFIVGWAFGGILNLFIGVYVL